MAKFLVAKSMPIRDHNPSGKFPLITVSLITLNVLIFLYQLSLSEAQLNNFLFTYAIVPAQINFSDISTLTPFVTSMFLHGGLIHIASNMLFLWVFGDNVEAALGKIKFLLFYLIGGVAGSLLQLVIIAGSTIPMLGASGAIAAVLGAYVVLYPRARVDVILPIFFIPIVMAVPAGFMIIYWFATQLFSGAASIVSQTASFGGVAFFAHIGGFAAGFIMIQLIRPGVSSRS